MKSKLKTLIYGEVETLPQFHLRAFQIRSEYFLFQGETRQVNNLAGKYIMEMSKLGHLQQYMTTFQLKYRRFERLPRRHQISTIFNSTIEEVIETPETVDVYMSTAYSVIEPIVNHNFGNKFQHHNGPNKRQHIHKNTSQYYQPIYYQSLSTSSIIYLK